MSIYDPNPEQSLARIQALEKELADLKAKHNTLDIQNKISWDSFSDYPKKYHKNSIIKPNKNQSKTTDKPDQNYGLSAWKPENNQKKTRIKPGNNQNKTRIKPGKSWKKTRG